MGKRHKNTMNRQQQRATAEAKTAARSRYELHAATADLHRQGLLRVLRDRGREGDATVPPEYRRFLPARIRVRMERDGWPEPQHKIALWAVGNDKFIATCLCSRLRTNAMGESHAKGAGTRHLNLVAAA